MSIKKNTKTDTGSEARHISISTPGNKAPQDSINVKEESSLENEKVGVEGEPSDLQVIIERLEKEAKDNYDRFLRVSAEFENFKKRSARETADFKKYANEALIRELLPVVDNLERAMSSAAENNKISSLLEGIDLTHQEILRIFERFNVKPIRALGEAFNPVFHQAVMQAEAEHEPEQTVLNELQKGYTIHDRLLRPTMVVVSKGGEKAPLEETADRNESRQVENHEKDG